MTIFNETKFRELEEINENYCISIYMPAPAGGDNRNKSMLKLKNHATAIEKELEKIGLKPNEIEDYLNPINELIDDSNLWRHLDVSLAIFRNKEKFEYYSLPVEVEEFSLVSDTFYLLPLLQFFNKKDSFYIFSLSKKKNRLYQATQKEITEIETAADFPSTIYDSTGPDPASLDVNIRSVGSRGSHGQTHFYGKGDFDVQQKKLRLYFEDINKALTDTIGVDGEPLVIATVESNFGHFKEHSSYKNIHPEFIEGNFDDENPSHLHERAKEILQAYFKEAKTDKKEALIAGNIPQTSDLKEGIIAADAGRISTLFVAKDKHVWGKYKPKKAEIEIHQTKEMLDSCLLDLAARKTFIKGGKVFVVEQENLPGKDNMINAALRF